MSEYSFISVWIWHNQMKSEIHMLEPTTIVSEYHSRPILSWLKTVIMFINNVWLYRIIIKQDYIKISGYTAFMAAYRHRKVMALYYQN